MKISQLLTLVAVIGVGFGGLVVLMREVHGNRHWVMSVQDQPGGMILLIGTATTKVPDSIDKPDFKIVVKGFSLGRDIKPLVLDESDPQLPEGWVLGLMDTTILPGRCQLNIGPLYLDFCSAFLESNGVSGSPGEQIEVVIVPRSVAEQARPVSISP